MQVAQPHSSPPVAIISVIASMGLLALGNGLMFAYIPVQLAERGFPPWMAGAAVTSMATGGLLACLLTGWVVRRVGHARTFATMTACVILSVLLISLGTLPYVWVVARAVYGFAATGLFIVTQSWLNDACDNAWRGKVIATFYMVYVIAIGAGSFSLRFVPLEGATVPLLGIFFATLALLPVCLTRLQTPPPPASITIAIRSVWRISPVGLVGLFASGGLTLLLQGFAPIYVTTEGYDKDDVGLLMFLMQFGMLAIQYPLGALSDRIDRRYALILACAFIIVTGGIATQLPLDEFIWVVIVFAIWAGATESVFSIGNAHANDRADPQYYVSLSSTLLVAWSVAGLILPLIATALIPVFGAKVFMYIAIAIAIAYLAFVAFRLQMRESPPDDETVDHQPVSAQMPLTAELATAQQEDDE
ncbi:MAG: MFS transporter [Pseudomonadota bacterium]